MGLFSSLFGGGGSSSSSTSTTTTTEQVNVPLTASSEGVSAYNSTVNQLDNGAIERAFLFADSIFEESINTIDKALSIAETAGLLASETTEKVGGLISSAYQTANRVDDPVDITKIVYVGGGIAALFGLGFIIRGRKK